MGKMNKPNWRKFANEIGATPLQKRMAAILETINGPECALAFMVGIREGAAREERLRDMAKAAERMADLWDKDSSSPERKAENDE